MSDSKQSQQKWRAEELRDQRKARLAGMKSKTGGKKPIRTGNKAAVLITALILVVVLAAGGIWWVVNLGIPQRTVAALAIGGENITAAEFNYYYYSQLSYYSIDPSTDDGKSTLAGAYDETFATVGDYLKDQAAKELQQTVVLCQAAKAANVTLDETDMKTVDSYMSNIEYYAQSDSKTLENYLIANYGKGVNENVMRGILERYVLSDKYKAQLQDAYGFTDADIQKYYDENKDDFDFVTYRSFYIASVVATDATDEEKKTALAAAKAKANEMFGKISSEATFKAMCIEYAVNETEKKKYTDEDASLTEDALLSDVYNEDQSTWLFAAARKAGDKIVIESTSGYYVLYFVSREQNTTEHVSVRHILIEAARETATEAQIAAAKTKAESILAGYLAGAKTEDAFAALVADNTADTGSAATGGLYSDISPSSSYVEEFLAWAVDGSRKTGDTGIVQTEFGFHIMYFVGVDSIEWKLNVENTLISEKYNAYLEELVKAKPYTFNSFGLRFVG